MLELVIGIAQGFIASRISRTKSTCRSPFSRLAALDLDIVSELEATLEGSRGDVKIHDLKTAYQKAIGH